MKYIRTKDNVSQIKTKTNCKELYDYLIQFDNYKYDLIKVADTIEELCDEFVVIVEGKHYIRVPAGNSNFEIYGAIWTDKGLIYVAKMNEKGELELL